MNSALERMKKQQLERMQKEANIKNRAAEKAKYKILLEQKGIADREAAIRRKEDEAQEKIRLAEEKRLADIDDKTLKYYTINQYGRKKAVEGMPMYFGETTRIHPHFGKESAWIPDGIGEFHYDGSIQREGRFKKGKMYGEGKYNFNESNYFGEFKADSMHGNGIMVTSKGREFVLMRDNTVMCTKDGKGGVVLCGVVAVVVVVVVCNLSVRIHMLLMLGAFPQN